MTDFRNNVKIIAIAGGTASGKTTIAKKIASLIKGESFIYLNMDSYYKQINYLPLSERRKINFDHPDALDIPLLLEHIKLLKEFKSIEKPIYDFTNNERTNEFEIVEPGEVIIIDGILALAIPEIAELADIKIFIKTEPDIRLIRRLKRDVTERGRTIESVIDQYLTTVKPMHEFFVEPSIKNADIIVPYYNGNDIAIDMIATKIRDLFTKSNN